MALLHRTRTPSPTYTPAISDKLRRSLLSGQSKGLLTLLKCTMCAMCSSSRQVARCPAHPVSKNILLFQKVQKQVDNLGEFVSSLPALMKQVVVYTYASLGQTYVSSSEGRRAGWALCAVNVAVWAAWQIPRLRPFMHMHFAHNPLSGKTYTMFTSIFR